MSKAKKLLLALCKTPPPKDFRWEDLVTLMRQAEFVETCDGGSHYMFEHVSGYRVRLSKTHPDGTLKPYQVCAAKEALRTVGKIEEGENG